MYNNNQDPYAKSRKALVDLIEKWSQKLTERYGHVDLVVIRIIAEMEEVIKTERVL